MLINDIHERTGYRLDVLEKDYYVVLMLEELAKKQEEGLPVYVYEPVTDYDRDDALQRFGKLKIEATSFTISEPVTSMEGSGFDTWRACADRSK